jgi:hypothetical protein
LTPLSLSVGSKVAGHGVTRASAFDFPDDDNRDDLRHAQEESKSDAKRRQAALGRHHGRARLLSLLALSARA